MDFMGLRIYKNVFFCQKTQPFPMGIEFAQTDNAVEFCHFLDEIDKSLFLHFVRHIMQDVCWQIVG